VRVVDVPRPSIAATEVLVQTSASLISSGTERAVTALAQSSLLAKARARPDLVRQVIHKARTEGLAQTARTVRDRLDSDVPLGYSAAGIVLEVGDHVAGVSPGQLVATAGAGKANHAELQAVPGLLAVPVPDHVPAGDAAFAAVASIGLHGLRLAEVGPGSKVVVVGLGLVGQLTARLALAAGCSVAGIDVADLPLERARAEGVEAILETGDETSARILDWSRGRGADAVIVTAAGKSSEPMLRTPALCRDRATIVVVGDVGLDLDRRPLYEKELSLRFARSYGPGRYERSYEDWAVDFPAGQVRWTEGRNLEAVIDLLASGRLRVGDLVTHRYAVEDAAEAYQLMETNREPYLAIALSYRETLEPERPLVVSTAAVTGQLRVGFVGAGAFASSILAPRFKDAGAELVSVASASGLSARHLAERAGFRHAVAGADGVIDDPDVDAVVIATPHDTHAELSVRALRAGKHVFCEKPIALTEQELDEVEKTWRESGRALMVGFNRRWSPLVGRLREQLASGVGPLVINYRVNAGPLPEEHWYRDRRFGGRLLGEVCHFIDTCGAIVGDDAAAVSAIASSSRERALGDDLVVTLAYASGSLAVITYAGAGHHSTEKERIEVLGRGHSAVLTDFRSLTVDGKSDSGRQQKGHIEEVEAFVAACRGHDAQTEQQLNSMRQALAAAESLSTDPA
jgi:predicted dehydrogenase/threonine dehydrogenase-like Zn-dependent dehydrogenase